MNPAVPIVLAVSESAVQPSLLFVACGSAVIGALVMAVAVCVLVALQDRDPLKAMLRKFHDDLLDKLLAARVKSGFKNDAGEAWEKKDWSKKLTVDLLKHIAKGDPLDVAAYAAFAHHHRWQTCPSVNVNNYLATHDLVIRPVLLGSGEVRWTALRRFAPPIMSDTLLGVVAELLAVANAQTD